jgi:hypothetical protein
MADRKGKSFANGNGTESGGPGAPYSEHSGWLFPPPIDWEFAKTILY